jgi:hypothetical protein
MVIAMLFYHSGDESAGMAVAARRSILGAIRAAARQLRTPGQLS